jgi:hypothetical protein
MVAVVEGVEYFRVLAVQPFLRVALAVLQMQLLLEV